MKTVLVTGGTTRIGKAIADKLRADGWRVLTSSHRADSMADITADLSEPMGAAKLYLRALEIAPDICAIVNNAAVFTGDAAEMNLINLEAPRKLTMLLAGKEDCKCAIVNILDAEVVGGGVCDNLNEGEKGAYLKTKRELLEYTRKAACLFAQTLRVNAVAPGPVLAPVAVHEKAGETLLDRRPTAADVADAVAYLLAAESVTGAIIPVDSGQHLIQG
jgi:NAD(P)-dependent dehydrogenase (short-subunit alcohol dehydrogenase family)